MPPASLVGTSVVAEDRGPVVFKGPEDRAVAMMGTCCE